jgi:hypothetical protein
MAAGVRFPDELKRLGVENQATQSSDIIQVKVKARNLVDAVSEVGRINAW